MTVVPQKPSKPLPPPPAQSHASPLEPEAEHIGSIWKHPYMIYIILTVGLFVFLVLLGCVAWMENWIPNRGTLR